MKVNNIRLITDNELEKINRKLLWGYGRLNQIQSGSVLEYENGKKQYCIQLVGSNPYKQLPLLKKIGAVIKEFFGADEVYHSGTQIA